MDAKIKNILTDIRFYIVLLFLLRLYGITDAPIESSHSWRQAFTNMITRNFVEGGLDILHPKIDLGGAKTGIVGSEFPFFNFLTYLPSILFGYEHWYGRLINLLVSSTGLYFFYKLVRDLLSKRVAFNATLVLALSIWVTFSRKIMPDTFSVSLVIIGLYYGYLYLKKGNYSSLISFFIFGTLGMLCKIPALSIFGVIGVLVFVKQLDVARRRNLLITATISVIIVCAWYFYWVPHLLATYHYQLYISKSLLEGMQEIKPVLGKFFQRFYFDTFHSFIASVCALLGLVFLIKQKQKLILLSLGIMSFLFLVFVCKTGNVFPLHSYYVIPFVPVAALLLGYFLAQIPSKFQYLLLLLISIESIANQQHDFRIKSNQLPLLTLEDKIAPFGEPTDLIVTSGGRTYKNMYFAHRKGWVAYNHNIKRTAFTDSLANLGAKYLLINKLDLDYSSDKYERLYDDENFSFYQLTQPK